MKKYLFLIIPLLLLTGCGRVRSEANLKSYAKQQYGKATLIRTESADKSRTCYFRDKKLGFEYYVTSSLSPVTIDGTYFGSVENTYSDFDQLYSAYLADKLNNENDLTDAATGYFIPSYSCLSLQIDGSLPNCEETIQSLAALAKKADIKKRLTYNMSILDQSGDSLGEYDFNRSRYLTLSDVESEYFMDCIYQYTRVKPQYLYWENLPLAEVPGIDNFTKADILGSKDYAQEGVDLYYFDIDGKTYFITDYCVYEESYPEGSDILYYNTYTGSLYRPR